MYSTDIDNSLRDGTTIYGPIPTPKVEVEKTLADYIKAIQDKVPEDKPKVSDSVNPKHYDLFPEYGIQVRELMQVLCDKLDNQGHSGFLASDYVQAMQYFLRWFDKNGVEDIEKGVWYMQKIIHQLKENGKENASNS